MARTKSNGLEKRNGLAEFVERCSMTGKALLLLGAIGGGGLTAGLLLDDVMGVPTRVEANRLAIITQDSAHVSIMRQADSVTEIFRDSILSVQSNILRTLRAWLCIESARSEGRTTVRCGLQQLLPSNDGGT